MSRKLALFLLTGILITCVVQTGCSGPTKPKNRENRSCANCLVARTSPGNVLEDFRIIYSVKDNEVTTPDEAHALALDYRALFHPDFKFYFATGDIMPNFPQGWWGRDDEVAAFDSMMVSKAEGSTTDIQLSWTTAPADSDNRIDEDGALLHPTWMRIRVSAILLDIIRGQTTYRVSDGTADFYFARDPADTTLWVISEWDDHPPSSS